MLKAASLIYAITIIFLTGIIASSFLLFQSLSKKESDLYLLQYRLNKNARSGIEFLMAIGDEMNYDEPKTISITEAEYDAVTIEKKAWGMFDIAVSSASFKNKKSELSCLIGAQFISEEKNGLYVADMDRAIAVCGKTRMDGITYLPAAGVKRAYIEGQNYIGEQLVYGTQRKSDRYIPDLNRKILERNLDRLKGKESYSDSVIDFSYIQNDTLIQPFSSKTLLVKSTGKIILSQGYFEGNIIFYSPSEIQLSGNCRLRNVVLYAPKIEIGSKDTCVLQAFARDTLTVKEKSVLLYPSILGIINEEKNLKNEPLMTLEKEVLVAGSVFAFAFFPDYKKPVKVVLNENTVVFGEIYSSGEAQLQGEVYGRAITQKLTLKTNSSSYENHLLNAVIDGNKIPADFCGIELKDKRYKKTILNWL